MTDAIHGARDEGTAMRRVTSDEGTAMQMSPSSAVLHPLSLPAVGGSVFLAGMLDAGVAAAANRSCKSVALVPAAEDIDAGPGVAPPE